MLLRTVILGNETEKNRIKRYKSEQFAQIRPCWNRCANAQTTTVDLYEVFNALLYLLKSGCQWRMLPEGFPKWYTVYSYFAKWREPIRME